MVRGTQLKFRVGVVVIVITCGGSGIWIAVTFARHLP